MKLTQRAAFGDLQKYLGLTLTELPNDDATALLLGSFNRLFVLFDKGALFFDDTDTKKQAIQLEMEVRGAAESYFIEYAPKQILLDVETYDNPLAESVNLGNFKFSEKGNTKTNLLKWYLDEAKENKDQKGIRVQSLLFGETDTRAQSNYL